MKPRARKLLLAALVGALTLALVEGGARLGLRALPDEAAPLQLGDEGEWDELMQQLYRADEELFFRLRPGLAIDRTENPRIFDVRTNSLGLRGRETTRAKPEGTRRVLCVGDSCTFGSGAGDADTWPAQLERALAAAEPSRAVEVLNAGVPGFSSYQGLRYLEREGFALDPDVVVFALGFNDTFQARPGPRRRFVAGAYLSDREYAEAAAAARGAPRWAVLELWKRLRGGAPQPASRPEQPNASRKRRVSPKEYWANLRSVVRGCLARGATPVLVVWPIAAQTDPSGPLGRHGTLPLYQRAVREIAERTDARVVDLVPLVAGRPELFIDDVHMNARGYRRVARAVAQALAGG